MDAEQKRSKENFEKFRNSKFSKKNFAEISFGNSNHAKFSKEAVLVLGAGIINCLNKQRVKRAIDYCKNKKVSNYNNEKDNQKISIIFSGGKGGFLGKYMKKTEAEKMREYALKSGIESKLISLEREALDTKENFEKSKKLINMLEVDKVVVVTNKAHMKRAVKYAEEILKGHEILAFSTKPKWYNIKGQIGEAACFLYEKLLKNS